MDAAMACLPHATFTFWVAMLGAAWVGATAGFFIAAICKMAKDE